MVDVYSDWSGPCSAMTNFLKKIKLEVNDDLLHYAMAKSGEFSICKYHVENKVRHLYFSVKMAFSDTIPQLELFRGQCKPTWLFVAGGQPVTVMHGANAPLLQRMIETEMRKERQVLKGEAEREIISLEDAVPSKFP